MTRQERRVAVAATIQARCQASGVTEGQIANATGYGRACVGRQLRGEDAIPLDCLPAYGRLLGQPFVDQQLEPLGLRSVPLEQAEPTAEDVNEAAVDTMREVADAVSKTLEAARGGLTMQEARALAPEIEEARAKLAALAAIVARAQLGRAA